jgi:ABC-2 type transport system ATP-binding protein
VTSVPSPTAPPIEVNALSKTYRLGFWMNKTVRALQELDLRVESGQVYGILGPNGAGKSTTLKILLNLVRQTGGEARLFGMSPSSREARRLVGFLPENPAPYEYLTGREFVTLAGRLVGLSGQALDARTKEVLGDIDMERSADLQIRRYSKGMIQRIGFAQAVVGRPKLLILDEPTSGLDPVGRRQLRDHILAERARGTTVLFCTHIIPDVEALCDRVVVLVGGKRVQEGSVHDLVTGKSSTVEMTLSGIDVEKLKALGHELLSVQALQDRVLIRVADADAQPLLRKAFDAGARLTQLQSVRFSLEDLFFKALKDANSKSVGGEIS